jgi:hypothetical protein
MCLEKPAALRGGNTNHNKVRGFRFDLNQTWINSWVRGPQYFLRPEAAKRVRRRRAQARRVHGLRRLGTESSRLAQRES